MDKLTYEQWKEMTKEYHIADIAKGLENMPIQKDKSKDIPGKDGYSVRDIEKIINVIDNYTPIPENGDDDHDDCFKRSTEFILLIMTLISLWKGQ